VSYCTAQSHRKYSQETIDHEKSEKERERESARESARESESARARKETE
jgi:hypothetical protein